MLTDLQIKKLTRYFQVIDIDDDGEIRARDFERITENVRILHGDDGSTEQNGLEAAYRDRWQRLRSADGDGDGGVDIDEWLAFWGGILADDAAFELEVQTVTDRFFTIFDLDEDEVIGVREFVDFYGIFGLPVTLAETIFEALDANEDGAITRAEFLDATREFYRSDDVEARGNFLFGPYGA